jgi:hypothetical protein
MTTRRPPAYLGLAMSPDSRAALLRLLAAADGRAPCQEPDAHLVFLSESRAGQHAAVRACHGCPFRTECQDYADTLTRHELAHSGVLAGRGSRVRPRPVAAAS